MWSNTNSGGMYSTSCGVYGCYTGGCYLGCIVDCRGTCYAGQSCTGQLLNSTNTGYMGMITCTSCTAPSYCKGYTRADALGCQGLATS